MLCHSTITIALRGNFITLKRSSKVIFMNLHSSRMGFIPGLPTWVWFSFRHTYLSDKRGKKQALFKVLWDNWDNKGQVVWFSLEERFLRNLTFDYCSCVFSEEQPCGGDAKYQSADNDEQISHLLGKCAHQISIWGVRRRMRFLISLSPTSTPAVRDSL